MSTGQGAAIIDFGGWPGANEAFVAVAGQASILATSHCEAFIMADDTTVDHTAGDHRYFSALVGLSCGTPTAAIGFSIHAYSPQKLMGTYSLRWVWADV